MSSEFSERETAKYVRCIWCGAPNPGTETLCGRCGKSLHPTPSDSEPGSATAAQITCPKCGKGLPTGGRFCGFCGAALPPVAPTPAKDSERAAQPVAPKVSAPPGPPQVRSADPTPTPSSPPDAPAAKPAAGPAVGATEGTQVFTGMLAPTVEASVSEVKLDGSLGRSVRMTKETFIGRGSCDLSYPDDALLAPRHASLAIREGRILLKDQSSPNGTFLKQRQDTELAPGDVFLLGRELFRFTTQSLDEPNPGGTQVMTGAPKLQRGPVTAKLEHIQLSGEVIEEFKLEKPETTLGRNMGDLIFKNDPYMSGTHARVVAQPGRFILQDLKSRNGVYRRIRDEVELRDGDEFFLGEQLFRAAIKVT